MRRWERGIRWGATADEQKEVARPRVISNGQVKEVTYPIPLTLAQTAPPSDVPDGRYCKNVVDADETESVSNGRKLHAARRGDMPRDSLAEI